MIEAVGDLPPVVVSDLKSAGRVLDGHTHDALPAPAITP